MAPLIAAAVGLAAATQAPRRRRHYAASAGSVTAPRAAELIRRARAIKSALGC